MKKLSQFVKFDVDAFLDGKILQVVGIAPWSDYNTKAHMGTRIETIIAQDKTVYKCKEGEVVSNRYEKLSIKVRKDVNVPINACIMPVNAVGVVYGDYRNQLSVTADDIRILQTKNA